MSLSISSIQNRKAIEKMELVNFYSFFKIENLSQYAKTLEDFAIKQRLTGSIRISSEGINLALCGQPKNIHTFIEKKILIYTTIKKALLRRNQLEKPAFKRLRVRIRDEIVTSNLPLSSPLANSQNTYVSPAVFQELGNDPNFCLLDMRNDYEVAIGTFQNAKHISMSEFNELSQIYSRLEKYRDKTLVSFCTGGIRCEKAVPFLKEKGFDILQLHGGILHYLEKYGRSKENLWEGDCFVFDDRIALKANLEISPYDWCPDCGQPSKKGLCTMNCRKLSSF